MEITAIVKIDAATELPALLRSLAPLLRNGALTTSSASPETEGHDTGGSVKRALKSEDRTRMIHIPFTV
jgi:hypothetical protein